MFGKVFRSLWQGSLCGKADEQLVFVYLLANADSDGNAEMVQTIIAHQTGLPLDRVMAAIDNLMATDPQSRSPEQEGRRLLPLGDRNWGWQITNYPKYRAMRDENDRREQNRKAKAGQRGRGKSANVSQGQPQAAQAEAEAEAEAEGKKKHLSARPKADASPVIFELPLRDGTTHEIHESQVPKWRKAYPDVDIIPTLREQLAWLEANPGRRKTKKGIVRFINGWFLKEQNTPPRETAFNGTSTFRR